MKINFKKLTIKTDRKGLHTQDIDIAENLGEILYQSAKTRKDRSTADLVGDSTGEIELDESRAKFVAETILNTTFPYPVKLAVLEALGMDEMLGEE